MHKAKLLLSSTERKLFDREVLWLVCRCSIGKEHETTPYKREGIGAGARMWVHQQKTPIIVPGKQQEHMMTKWGVK